MSGSNALPGAASLTETAFELVQLLEADGLHAGFSTSVRRGSSVGVVEVVPDPWSPPAELLAVRMAIMRAPATDQERFWRTLAELNGQFLGRAAFTLAPDGTVWLASSHPIHDMDSGEMLDLILWTANMADEMDDRLLDAFGRDLAV